MYSLPSIPLAPPSYKAQSGGKSNSSSGPDSDGGRPDGPTAPPGHPGRPSGGWRTDDYVFGLMEPLLNFGAINETAHNLRGHIASFWSYANRREHGKDMNDILADNHYTPIIFSFTVHGPQSMSVDIGITLLSSVEDMYRLVDEETGGNLAKFHLSVDGALLPRSGATLGVLGITATSNIKLHVRQVLRGGGKIGNVRLLKRGDRGGIEGR